MTAEFIGILVYIAASLVIGLLVSRAIRTESDYLLAGRNLGYMLATFSIFATWFGAETCIGSAASVYDNGIQGGRADPFGYSICLFLMGLFFAVPLWKMQLTTLADLFRIRYSAGIERLAALIIFPSSVIWAAAQIRAFGHVLSSAAPLELTTCITVAAVIVIIYTVSGGLLADAMTDVIQGAALILGLLVLFIVVLLNDTGNTAVSVANSANNAVSESWLDIADGWAIPIFGSIVAQELISRVLASRSPKVAQRSTFAATGIYLAIGLIPIYIGLVGFRLFPGLESSEAIMPLVAKEFLPKILYIIYAGAIASAILSTVDSALLAASALVSHNVILPLRQGITEKQKVLFARAGVVFFGILAYIIAIFGTTTYEMVEQASGFGSAGIFVIAVFGLFTTIGGSISAAAALIAGIVVWIIGSYIFEISGSYIFSLSAALLSYLLFSFQRSK